MSLLDVILGYDCNLACDYCTITPQMRRRSLGGRAIAAALADGRRRGLTRLSLTGGEPTIRADLLPLIRHARAVGYDDIKLQSNGLLWASPGNVARAVEAGVTRFHLSIHAHRRERYDAIVQRPGTFDAMVAGLDNLVAARLDPVVDLIVMASTLADLPDAVTWLHRRGLRRVDLWYVSLTDANAARPESMPPMTEAVPTLRQAFARGRERGMTIRSLHVPRCLLGPDAGHAWDPAAQGVRVVTPDATFDLTGSALTGQVHVPACEGCEHRGVCPGIRRDYLTRFGDVEIASARGQRASRTGAVRLMLAPSARGAAP